MPVTYGLTQRPPSTQRDVPKTFCDLGELRVSTSVAVAAPVTDGRTQSPQSTQSSFNVLAGFASSA